MVLAHGKYGNIFNDDHVIERIFKHGVVYHFLRVSEERIEHLKTLLVALATEQHRLGGTHRRFDQTLSVGVLSNALLANAAEAELTFRIVRKASAIIANFSSLLA